MVPDRVNRLRRYCLARLKSPGVLVAAFLACAAGTAPGVMADTDSVRAPAASPAPIAVVVDIRPGLCPNHIRVGSTLMIGIAVLGTMDFEAANIEPGTIRLSLDGVVGEVEPAGWVFKDVGFPIIGGRCACHELRGDGLDDLELQFSISDLTAALGLKKHVGAMIPLTLTGNLVTGEAIEGVDCALIIDEAWGDEHLGGEIGMLAAAAEEHATLPLDFTYYTMVSDRVTFAVYDVGGNVVATLADMDMAPGIYNATWDGTNHGSQKVPAGTYFARVSNSSASDIRKISVLQ